MEGYIDRELALTLVQRLKNWVQGAARQKPVRSWHHLSSIYSVSRILPLPLLLLRTHLRTPLAFVPPFSGAVTAGPQKWQGKMQEPQVQGPQGVGIWTRPVGMFTFLPETDRHRAFTGPRHVQTCFYLFLHHLHVCLQVVHTCCCL